MIPVYTPTRHDSNNKQSMTHITKPNKEWFQLPYQTKHVSNNYTKQSMVPVTIANKAWFQ